MYTQINIYLQIDVMLGISTGNETSVFTILYGQDLYVGYIVSLKYFTGFSNVHYLSN